MTTTKFEKTITHLKYVHNLPECFDPIPGPETELGVIDQHEKYHAGEYVRGNFDTIVGHHSVVDLDFDPFTRCPCGVAIHPDYKFCEACEYGECGGCGEKVWTTTIFSTEEPARRFCDRCIEDGTGTRRIAQSEEWARRTL